MRTRIVLAVLLVAAVAALPGCFPWDSSYRIDPDLNITDSGGMDLDEIHVSEGDLVQFCNNAECTVVLIFGEEGRDLFGRETVRILPGRCVVLRVYSTAYTGEDYYFEVICSDAADGGGVAAPKVVVDDPDD